MKEQKKEGLLKRLSNKIKNKTADISAKISEKLFKSKNKIALKVAGLVLTASMALTMAACTFNQPVETLPDNPAPIETLDEGYDYSDNRYPGLSETQDLTETQKPTETQKQTESVQTENTEKEEKYSEVLQYVLNNKEYNNIIKEAKEKDEKYGDANDMLHLFEETPFGFYEDQGYNVQAVKNNQLESTTVVYKKANEPNSLYVNTNIETIGATPYLTQYVLKYHLSDKEMDEFVWLHQNKYIQAQFMVDAISQTREPEILSECKITVSAQNNLVDSLGQYDLTKSLLNDIDFGNTFIQSFDVEAGTCTLMITSKQSLMSMSTAGYQNVITIGSKVQNVRATVDGAYAGPAGLNTYTYSEELNTSEPTNIIFFNEMVDLAKTNNFEI